MLIITSIIIIKIIITSIIIIIIIMAYESILLYYFCLTHINLYRGIIYAMLLLFAIGVVEYGTISSYFEPVFRRGAYNYALT